MNPLALRWLTVFGIAVTSAALAPVLMVQLPAAILALWSTAGFARNFRRDP